MSVENIKIVENLNEIERKSVLNMVEDSSCYVFFPHEWNTRKRQILSHIRSYDQQTRKIPARKCCVQSIDIKTLRSFCEDFHIQGSNRLAVVGWGLYYEDELLGVISLGRHHRQNDEKVMVLDRMCFKENIRVVGGAGKLFSVLKKWAMEQGLKSIISFSDNRWSNGNIYEKLGFTMETTLSPDYFYVSADDFGKYFSKQSQKKSATNCPDDMTEKQWALTRGLIQVFDAGKKKWVYKIRRERTVKYPLKDRRQGYYQTLKSDVIYYQSSYELRAAYLLDHMEDVITYSTQVRFVLNSKERYIDFLVRWKDGTYSIIEVKPSRRQQQFNEQLEDNKNYAEKQGWKFTVWTEKELGFKSEYYIKKWTDEFLSTIKETDFIEESRKRNLKRSKTYYARQIAADKVKVWCDYCQEYHEPLRLTYEKNIDRNGEYICERKGGSIAGKKPKKKKENPYAAEGKKKCNGCSGIKLFEEFGTDKAKSDGLATICKECRANKARGKYQSKIEDI